MFSPSCACAVQQKKAPYGALFQLDIASWLCVGGVEKKQAALFAQRGLFLERQPSHGGDDACLW